MGIDSNAYQVLADIIKKEVFSPKIPTIGAIDIATFAEENHVKVKVLDFYADDVSGYNADIIGISSTFMSLQHIREIAYFTRQNNPTSTIVLGGPLSWTILPSVIFKLVPEIDVIVQGEGEQTFTELIESISKGEDFGKVAGLFVKHNNSIVFTGHRARLDGDAIPMPQWRLLNKSLANMFPFLPIETSRGCPYKCAYCSEVHYWGKPPRYRSLNSILDEIERNVYEFGINTFRFTDSCFSAPPERAANLCDTIYDRLGRNGITIKWSSYAHIKNLTYSLLEKMKRSGCFALDIGVESGAPQILRRMGRRYSREDIINVSRAAKDLDILTDFNIVVGFPGETDETLNQTIDMLQEAIPDAFSCFVLFIAPHMIISEHPEIYGIKGSGLSWSHATMTSEDAYQALRMISKNATNSCSFPGAESFACNLTALGYSTEQIRSFFKATQKLTHCANDRIARTSIENVCEKLRALW